jgi:lipid-A-disaccharide synthase-like uncharacterized protein
LAAAALALRFSSIIDLFGTAFGVLLAFLPTTVAMLTCERVSVPAAFWSIVVAGGVALPASIVRPKEAFVVVAFVSVAVYVVVAVRERRRTMTPSV